MVRMINRMILAAVIGLGALAGGALFLYSRPTLVDARHAQYESELRRLFERAERALTQGDVAHGERADVGAYSRVFDYLLALEDRSFFQRRVSFDSRGMARALARLVVSGGGEVQGASGIPQQLASLTIDRTLGRRPAHDLRFKITQFLLASRTWDDYSRTAIEAAFLDVLPCGPVRGARACAIYLFGGELTAGPDLDLRAALIAAQVRAPSRLRQKRKALRARATYGMRVLARLQGQPPPAPVADWPKLKLDRASAMVAGELSVLDRGPPRPRTMLARALLAGLRSLPPAEPGSTLFATALLGPAAPRSSGGLYVSAGGAWDRHRLEAGSLAKVWMLRSIVGLGPRYSHYLTSVRLPPRAPVWDLRLRRWRPASIGVVESPLTLTEAVARSHNASCLGGFLYAAYWVDEAMLSRLLARHVTARERRRYSGSRDRRLALFSLQQLTGYPYLSLPSEADPKLSYRPLLLVSLRRFVASVRRDVPGVRAPVVPAALIGGGVTATARQWLAGLRAAWFRPGTGCQLTTSGRLLAGAMRERGTLQRVLVDVEATLPGKTGSARANAQAVVGLCARRPSDPTPTPLVVGVWAFSTNPGSELRTQGSRLGPGLASAIHELIKQGLELFEPDSGRRLSAPSKAYAKRASTGRSDRGD